MIYSEMKNLEVLVFSSLSKSNHENHKALYDQWRHSKLISCEFSGMGFFFRYLVESSQTHPLLQCRFLSGVQIYDLEDNIYADVVFFVKDGFLELLEIARYGDTWDADISTVTARCTSDSDK